MSLSSTCIIHPWDVTWRTYVAHTERNAVIHMRFISICLLILLNGIDQGAKTDSEEMIEIARRLASCYVRHFPGTV